MSIFEVNATHKYHKRHRIDRTVCWIENTLEDRVVELCNIVSNQYKPSEIKRRTRWDTCANKYREICEPQLWPDQYIHHMLINAIKPQMMRGMDPFCCGSIKGRGISLGVNSIKKWMKNDIRGTKYCMELDIHHFYNNINPKDVIDRLKHLIKDRKVLELAEIIMEDGVLIGLYPSQWFANTLLQPLDRLIRQPDMGVSHYIRYMDNLIIFSPNKRKLGKLKILIDEWLVNINLELNSNWQIFATENRMPQGLGFRYGRNCTLLKKKNKLKLTRQVNKIKKKIRNHENISFHLAASYLSRIGQMKKCSNYYFYQKYQPQGLEKICKSIVSEHSRKEALLWNIHSEEI